MIYFALHKPPNCLSSTIDSHSLGRRTIYDVIAECNKEGGSSAFPTAIGHVGRLDYETSGLLILTDDVNLSIAMTSPQYVSLLPPCFATYSPEMSRAKLTKQ